MKKYVLYLFILASMLLLLACRPENQPAAPNAQPEIESVEPTPADNNLSQLPTLNEITPIFQYADEELDELFRLCKTEKAIAIDESNSEKIECDGCIVIVDGVILTSPFFITVQNKTIYLNGYQYYPPRIRHIRKPEWLVRKSENYRHDPSPCAEAELEAKITMNKLFLRARKISDPIEAEAWLRQEMEKLGYKVKKIVFSETQDCVVWDIECKQNLVFESYHPPVSEADSRWNALSQEQKDEQILQMRLWQLKEILMLNRGGVYLFDPSSGSKISAPRRFLQNLYKVLMMDCDPRIKFEMMSRVVDFSNAAIFLVANQRQFVEEYRKQQND